MTKKRADRNYQLGRKQGSADIRRIVREYHKQCYTYKFDDLEEMDQLLEKHKLLQLTQYLNSLTSTKEIKFIVKILPKKKKISRSSCFYWRTLPNI